MYFTTSLPRCRFEESEAAKLQREDSRKLSLNQNDESFDNDNVYRLSIRQGKMLSSIVSPTQSFFFFVLTLCFLSFVRSSTKQ